LDTHAAATGPAKIAKSQKLSRNKLLLRRRMRVLIVIVSAKPHGNNAAA
jgi:hypothetical protein